MNRRTILQLLALLMPGCRAMAEPDFAAAREQMIATVQSLAETAERGGRRIDGRIIEAMRQVPRHLLVPEAARPSAYENRPLSIGHGQTISQPFIVALMTDLLRPQPDDVVL